MRIIEHKVLTSLRAQVERLKSGGEEDDWGAVRVRRDFLKTMTTEALALSIRTILSDISDVSLYFVDEKNLLIFWRGKVKEVARQLRSLIAATLVDPAAEVPASVLVSFLETNGPNTTLDHMIKLSEVTSKTEKAVTNLDSLDDEEFAYEQEDEGPRLIASGDQLKIYTELRNRKPYRKQIQVLIVEDQIFSQRILAEILRGARTSFNDGAIVEMSQGITEAWKLFIKSAPDIAFIDLGLLDGSGHALARAIKEIDPDAYVVIVTANACEEEMSVARQNNVDSFISKPYNKNQILACLDRYLSSRRGQSKGLFRGALGQYR